MVLPLKGIVLLIKSKVLLFKSKTLQFNSNCSETNKYQIRENSGNEIYKNRQRK